MGQRRKTEEYDQNTQQSEINEEENEYDGKEDFMINNDQRHPYQSQNKRNLTSHVEEDDDQEIEDQNEDDKHEEFEDGEAQPQDEEELVGQDIYRKINENAIAYTPEEELEYYYDDPVNYNKIMEKHERSGDYDSKNTIEYNNKIQEYEKQLHQGNKNFFNSL